MEIVRRFQWPRGLKRGFAAAGLPGLRVGIPPGTWMSVGSAVCFAGRNFCVGLVPRLEESYLV
jgi:hypothetical protein